MEGYDVFRGGNTTGHRELAKQSEKELILYLCVTP